MSKLSSVCIAAALLFSTAAFLPSSAAPSANDEEAIPNFNPNGQTAWRANRPASDDFLPHDKSTGPGPVESDPLFPYVPNGNGRQSTYRIADLSNPILKPWVIEQMRKWNDVVFKGGVPYIARERCWPAGVPGFDVWNRGQPLHIIQTPKMLMLVHELYSEIRRVYMNVPHSANVKPSWYGESVGHYEGDTLVVDTIGLNNRTFVDNYRTPHTTELHVTERFRMIEDGKTLEVEVTADDPGAFNMPWKAKQHWRRDNPVPMIEDLCEPQNAFFHGYDVVPIPEDQTPDF